MKLGVLTVVYQDVPLEAALDKLTALGVQAVELGTGNFPGDAHCDPDALLADARRVSALRDAVAARGLEISALSCHGNPLHPDAAHAAAAHAVWEKTLRLAEQLEVGVVNTFSGCPGDGPGARHPNWVTCAWPPEFLHLLDWQWNERAIPYWAEQCAAARAHGVTRIALEMHPGFLVYNPETLLRLRAAAGPEIGANFDPSHLFWQGIDAVAAIRELGDHGALFHAHAKDTYVDPRNRRVNGVLDTKPYSEVADRAWTFRTVGFGHGEETWRAILSALRVAGYDHVLSIEHEDMLASRDEGLGKAVEFLRRLMFTEPPAEAWWT
jgi:sugar phosphate isomerase/epimerase